MRYPTPRCSCRIAVPLCFAACVLLLLAGVPAVAQTLPEGEYRPFREREFDLLHYKAELDLAPRQGEVSGVATLTLAPLRELEELTLDAVALEVAGVSMGGASLGFEMGEEGLVVTLPKAAAAGERLEIAVRYSARPRSGMYFQPHPENPDLVFVHTYGEGGLHANWLPIYGDVNDKFSTEMVITVPPPYVAISNGRLLGTEDGPEGRRAYHYRQDLPHPGYLISVYAGDFERGELESASGAVPLAYWVPRGRLEEGAYAFRNTARMVEFFSARLGYPYPWDKYDQIAVPDYAVGAMEHTGVTGHKASVLRHQGEAPLDFGPPTFEEYSTDWTAEATISHELAHHWFGNDTTCRGLGGIWLNESFASYLMMLWDEESVGREQLDFDVVQARRHYFDYVAEEHTIRPLEYPRFDKPDDIYNEEHTYLKGAAVLHMLRHILGDEPFFRALGHFLKKHEFANVESGDFRAAIEESTGRNLSWFFEQWVTGAGHPVLEAEYVWREGLGEEGGGGGMVDLTVRQVQPLVEGQGLFRLPLEVTIATSEGTRVETVWVEEAEGRFLLPAAAEPRMVSLDGGGALVAEWRFEKDLPELARQARHDRLAGRLRALGRLAERFPARAETAATFRAVLEDPGAFWALKAEAALLLGELRAPAAGELAEVALASPDYRVRKAAVLALPGLGGEGAGERLRRVLAEDASTDVAATALVALAGVEPDLPAALLREQLARESWYDELPIAAMKAGETLARPELLEMVRPHATGASHNQHLRQAAWEAWRAIEPADPLLHQTLLAAAQGPPYALRKKAIEMLGELGVAEAVPVLEEMVAWDGDDNLTARAREALREIRRLEGAGGGS